MKIIISYITYIILTLTVYSQTVNVGLIGCGFRGEGALKDIMKASEITGIKVVPVAFCDYFRRKAVATAYKYNKNAAIYYDADGYKKMMADPNVHAVILATPPNFRPLHFEAAVKAKKHVFEEKPVAVDPEGCRRHFIAAEIALSNNLTVVAGTQNRHCFKRNLQFNMLQSGKFGKIIGGNIRYNIGTLRYNDKDFPNYKDFRDKRNGKPENNKNHYILNWYYYEEMSGDHIVEQHIHNIDVANWFIGRPPLSVSGFGGRLQREGGNINDFFNLVYDYGNGVKITSSCRQINGYNNDVGETFMTSSGYVFRVGKNITKDNVPINDYYIMVDGIKHANISPYVAEQIDFLYSIIGSTYQMEAFNVTWSTAAAIAGRLAAKTGEEVYINDMLFNIKSKFFHMNAEIQPEDFETNTVLKTIWEK